MLSLVIATHNAHKTAEFRTLIGAEFAIEDLTRYPQVPEPIEDGESFAENAAIKAIAASRRIGGWVLADDSGLEVDALKGAPGIYSARYAGDKASAEENVAKLLRELAKVESPADRRARFRCVLALARDGRVIATSDGAIEGTIVRTPAGGGGFGYDPIFVPDGFAKTFAEIPAASKNEISHRARAVADLGKTLVNLR